MSLNNKNLPDPDPIHPIIVHFVSAMVFFSFFCDVVGYLTRNPRLFEVSFWNMLIGAIAIFLAVIFGKFEGSLAQPYSAVKPVMHLHMNTGLSLLVLVVVITAWRFMLRKHNPLNVPPAYTWV